MDLDAFEGIRRKLNFSEMGKPALVGIAALLVLVAVVVAVRLVGAATVSSIEVTKGDEQQVSALVQSSSSSSHAEAQPQGEAHLFVHVAGAVLEPGLYELEAGARVADAVQRAGGFTEEAAQESVNLARSLSDGEQIMVATKQEAEQGLPGAAYAPDASQGTGGGGASAGLVNINTAGEAELVSLPGVGQSTAQKIISDRQSNGPYKVVDDLKRVSGIGDKKFEAIRELICV